MSIRFGVSPIAWINDDMPELGGDTPLASILADIQGVGFAGVELGGKFPRDPAALQPLLAGYGLDLVGGWYSGALLERDVAAEVAAAQDHLALLKAMGSRVWVHAETSNAIHGDRAVPLSRTPRLDAAGWKQFGARVSDFADYIAGEPAGTTAHNTRLRWANGVFQAPDSAAAAVIPTTVMDPNVQAQGSAIADADLQTAVETAVNKMM